MAMPTKTYSDAGRDAGFLHSELPGRMSREQAILAAGNVADRIAGTVLGRVTATGKLVPLAPAASDGSQNADSILLLRVPKSAADQRCAIVARGAEVNDNLLIWPAGITTNQKKAAEAALALKDILVRH